MTLAATFAALLWAYALYVFFLAYIPLVGAHERGALKTEPSVVLAAAYLTLGIGYVLDVGFNLLFASLIFAELPQRDYITFTKRCRKWRDDAGYRGRFARWVCHRLNVYQEHHC